MPENCEKALFLLDSQLDEPLEPELALELEEHLKICEACRKENQAMLGMKKALKYLDAQGLEAMKKPMISDKFLADKIMDSINRERVKPLFKWQESTPVFLVSLFVSVLVSLSFRGGPKPHEGIMMHIIGIVKTMMDQLIAGNQFFQEWRWFAISVIFLFILNGLLLFQVSKKTPYT